MYPKSPFKNSTLAGALFLALAAQAAGAATLNIETATIAGVQAAYATGKLTAEQLVQTYLARIAA